MNNKNANTARIGVHAVASIVSEELKWIFREQPIEDYGIDAHIEVCIDGKPTGRLIAVQIKCGESWFSTKSEDGYVFTGSLRHLEYWASYSLPVILIIYNPIIKQALWVPIETKRIQRLENMWKITVPFKSYFDKYAEEMLGKIAIPDYGKHKIIQELLCDYSSGKSPSTGVSQILDVLNMAENSLVLVSPFIDTAFFWILKSLSYRVRIRLITSDHVNEEVAHEIIQCINESPGIEIKVCPMLHIKYFILDGKISVYGSANLTKYSWRKSHEIVLATDDHKILQQFNNQFDQLWANSHYLYARH